MHKVLDDTQRILLSLSSEEAKAIVGALSHAATFGTLKSGLSTPSTIEALIGALEAEVHESRRTSELVEVWEDGSVMVRVMNTYGDPVEMGEVQAKEFAGNLQKAIQDAT
jgi:hypothetical protein